MSAATTFSQPKLIWHWMRKDFTALRSWFIAWAVLLLLHLVLRLVQLYAGDSALPELFEHTTRPDHLLQWFLLLMSVPLVMHQDSAPDPNFWKSRPISHQSLLAEKLCLLFLWFVLLPLVLDAVYFWLAGFRGSDLADALLFWLRPRLGFVLALAALASQSGKPGRFLMHATLCVVSATLAILLISFFSKDLVQVGGYASWFMELRTPVQTPIGALPDVFFSVLPPGVLAVSGFLILAVKYLRNWAAWRCYLLGFVALGCYTFFCYRFNQTERKVYVIPSDSNAFPLPQNPSEITIKLTFDERNFVSSRGTDLGSFYVETASKTQPILYGVSKATFANAATGKLVEQTYGYGMNAGGASFNANTYANFEEMRRSIFFRSNIFLHPKSILESKHFHDGSVGLDLDCWGAGATADILQELDPTESESFVAGDYIISYHKVADPISLRRNADARIDLVLGHDQALEVLNTRLLPPFPFRRNPLSDLAKGYSGGGIAVMEPSTGKIMRVALKNSPSTMHYDLTRFRSSLKSLLYVWSEVDAKRKAMFDLFQAHPENWRIIFAQIRGTGEFRLPIHLTPKDLDRQGINPATNNPSELSLHFNPATQRWETTDPSLK